MTTIDEQGRPEPPLRAGGRPPSASVVVVNQPPEVDLAEVVLDVAVRTVEAPLPCIRGVSDGLCR